VARHPAACCAFGVLEAAIYRDILYWEEMSTPTYVGPIGLSLYLALSFVGGHVILSIGSPIALVETLSPLEGTSVGSRHWWWSGWSSRRSSSVNGPP